MRTGKSAGSPAAFIACMWLSLASGFAGAEPLFEAAERPMNSEVVQRLESDSFIVPDRYRLARIDRDEIARSIDQGLPLVLNLFNDTEVRASVRSSRELASGSTFHFGELEGGGYFTLLLHHTGIVRGEVHSVRGTFVFRSEGSDRDRISIAQHDLSGVPMCGVGKEEFTPSVRHRELSNAEPKQGRPLETIPAVQAKSSTSEPVDVLIAYTQRVEDHEGGPEQTRATIENEVAKMNQVLENSGLAHRQVRLVAMEKVDYSQAGHVGTDLNNFENTSADNYNDFDFSPMDEVHELREKYQADLIHLVVKEARGLCGVSGVYGLPQENWIKDIKCSGSSNPESCLVIERRKEWKKQRSSSVSAVQCFSGYTFTHELGHNFALDHDRADTEWDEFSIERGIFTFRPYAFGHENVDFKETCQTTIMSAGNRCIEEGIYGQQRVPYFSNPDLFFPPPTGQYAGADFKPDTPMGVPGEEYTIDLDGPVNASRAIDDVWDIVASVSDPVGDLPPTVGQCLEGTPSSALESLNDRSIEMPADGGTRELTVSFPVAEGCSNVSLQAQPSDSFITTSVDKVREGEYRVVIGTSPSDGSSCETLSGRVTVSVSGVSHINSARIAVTQESASRLCRSIAELPEDSVALDLSSQNESVSLRLPDGFFSRFAELESLNLSNNRLTYIERAVFEGLEKLIDLDLSRNELTWLPEEVFLELRNLENLDLSRNRIEELDGNAFRLIVDRPHPLTSLDLSHNRIETLPYFAFEDLWKLKSLRLNDNRIKGEVSEYAFSGLLDLIELNLSRNELTGLAENRFSESKRMESLWLYSNDIASVHSNAFAGLSALRALSLSRNELAELPESVFSELSSLENLWLYRNRLTDLPAGLFSGLSELRTLSLSGNQLDGLLDGLFSDLAALEQLWLLDNDITEISSRTFTGLSNVRSLSLSGNELMELPDRTFAELPGVEALWLYGNDIARISPDAFDGLANLRYLDISNNPLSAPLPAKICTFLRGLNTLRAEGVEMEAICPQ